MNKRKAITYGMIALCVTLPMAGQEIKQQIFQISNTERVNFAPGGTVRLNGSYGKVYVEGWDTPEVEIKITKSTERFYDIKQQQQATGSLERIRVVTERRSDTELTISTELPVRSGVFKNKRGGVTVAYEIRMPRDSKLVIQNGGGFVHVENVTGDIDVSSSSGDIMIMVPDDGQYSIDAKTKIGLVSTDFAGGYRRKYILPRPLC